MKREDLPLGTSIQHTKILGVNCYVICDKQPDDSVSFLTKEDIWSSSLFDAQSFVYEHEAINRVKKLAQQTALKRGK
jgi:hypothetical protein